MAVAKSLVSEVVPIHAASLPDGGTPGIGVIIGHIACEVMSGRALPDVLAQAAVAIETALGDAVCLYTLGDDTRATRLEAGPFSVGFGSDAGAHTLLGAALATSGPIVVESFLRTAASDEHARAAIAAGCLSGFAFPILTPGTRAARGAIAIYLRREGALGAAVMGEVRQLCDVVAQAASVADRPKRTDSSSLRFAELASTIPGVVYQRVLTLEGDIHYTYISDGATELFGVDPETILRDPQALFNHYSPKYRAAFRQRLIDASRELRIWDVEAEIKRPDGSIRYTHAIAHPRQQADGSVLWTGVILDATRMKLAEKAAAEMETRTRHAIVESFSQGLLLFDGEGQLVVSNSRFLEINPGIETLIVPGASYEDIIGAELDPLRADHIVNSNMIAERERRLEAYRANGSAAFERQISGDRWILVNDTSTEDGGRVVLYTDVTEIKRRERDIEHMAHHDGLTGLPNRVMFRRKLEEALEMAHTNGEDVAVVYIDLDRFKIVNDTLGHPVGDGLLEIVGKRIVESIGAGNVAARLGGDEFAAIISKNATTEALTSIAWRLLDALGQPAMVKENQVVVGASIGIAVETGDGLSSDELLKNADLAVYRAKSDGRGTFRFFEAEMDAIAQQRRCLENDLRLAVRTKLLMVHYQPQVDVFTNQIVGAEALVRWNHEERGWIPPLDFIPLAEETGLIGEIGEFVLRKACSEAVSWPLGLRVSVNCSPAQFKNGKFVDLVASILKETGLDPDRLEMEVTESLLIHNSDANLKTLWGLRNLGVRVAMDDFGTGFSSLSNLRAFPFDRIKIDRSFIKDLKSSVDAAAIIRAIVSLGRSLGIATTAEGVETRDHLAYLRGEGCSEAQGFYYAAAMPNEEIHELLGRSQLGIIGPR